MLNCESMAFHVDIPKYSNKDIPIMVGTMFPMTLLMNYFLFGSRYFKEVSVLFGPLWSPFSCCVLPLASMGLWLFLYAEGFPGTMNYLNVWLFASPFSS